MRRFTDTVLVVTYHLNYSAAPYFATGALGDHPLKFVSQYRESLKTGLHFLQVMLGNGIDLLAGHVGLV
tara:strand:+ start:8427 stop:8633 length:207 start_codon:yes stop_codon:yes gene_type:complete